MEKSVLISTHRNVGHKKHAQPTPNPHQKLNALAFPACTLNCFNHDFPDSFSANATARCCGSTPIPLFRPKPCIQDGQLVRMVALPFSGMASANDSRLRCSIAAEMSGRDNDSVPASEQQLGTG